MSDKKLASFKAGSKHKPTSISKPKKATTAETARQTLGFARIEALIESEEPGQVAASLNDLLASLQTYEEQAKAAKDKASAKKAKAAVERTMDLLGYLYRVKDEMTASLNKG